MIKVLIVDDEPLARERLYRLVKEIDGFDPVASAENGLEALGFLNNNPIDLVLLDIQMPGLTGMEVAEQCQQMDNPPAIIFCTAYDQHAIDAFKVSAIDYLLKPIGSKALITALNKAKTWIEKMAPAATVQQPEAEPTYRKNISAKTHQGEALIPIDSIYYFHAEQKYTVVYHEEGEVLIDDSLKSLEQEYENVFFRVHRNALIAIDRIERLASTEEGHKVYLKGLETGISVSRRHAAGLKNLMRSL